MKRFWIMLLAVAVALVIALPAGAGQPDFCDPGSPDYREGGHPSCTTIDPEPPPPPEDLVCAFDPAGVLLYPDGEVIVNLGLEAMGHRCKLIADPTDSFEFAIGTTDGATVVQFPYIAVTDVYPSGGNICFRDYVGRVKNPDSELVYTFVTFAASEGIDIYGEIDGTCGASADTDGATTYALTFQIGNIKGGTVQLMVTPPPMQD
ncbi:MAG: hypothetical protein DRJ50_11160 [Actinobacteria bacterium]|nr:MAG: hypothetical protein DRJ50_11160 [Actinomycetota bacterium]